MKVEQTHLPEVSWKISGALSSPTVIRSNKNTETRQVVFKE